MTTTKDLSLDSVIGLLKKYTFQHTAEILGITGRNAGNYIRRFLEQKGIDPKLFTKKGKTSKRKSWFGSSQEYKTKPKIIRRYKYHGHTVTVYGARYARM